MRPCSTELTSAWSLVSTLLIAVRCVWYVLPTESDTARWTSCFRLHGATIEGHLQLVKSRVSGAGNVLNITQGGYCWGAAWGKAEVKRQKAEVRHNHFFILHSDFLLFRHLCLLPFYFCLSP